MIRLLISSCLVVTLASMSLAGSSCKDAKLCCITRSENCVLKKASMNTVDEGSGTKECFCDFTCLEKGDCCYDFKKTCGVESRPHRFHNLMKREANPEADKSPAMASDTPVDEKDDQDDYINEEGVEDDILNDDEDIEDNYDDEEDENDDDGPPLVLVSKPTNATVSEGETAWLNCALENANKKSVLIWMKGSTLIVQDSLLSNDKRISLYKNNTLSVRHVEKNDYGTYTCKIIDGVNTVEVHHRLIAPQAPRVVQMLPLDRERFIPEGKPIKIQCFVTGEPKPKITWSREGSRLTDENAEFGDQTLYIKSATRHDSGKYQCLATNGYGSPAVGKVTIKVWHAPDVHVKKSVVNTDEGYEATMLCTVKSNPVSIITWEKNDELIHDSHHHHIMMDEDRKHSTLRITKATSNDFGKYTCKAKNDFGSSEGHVILVKQPGRAMWVSGEQDMSDAPILQWAVESVQPVTDIELRYRKIDQSKSTGTTSEEEWIVVKPEIDQPNGNVYTVKHTLNGLSPGKYAAQVRSKNTHGWSDLSDQHMFDGAYEENDVLLRSHPFIDVPAVAGIRTAAGGVASLQISPITTMFLSAVTCVLVRIL